MAIPKYNEIYDPFLTAISDGKIHTAKEVASTVAIFFSFPRNI